MNFKSLVNEIGCDSRIKNGALDLKNEDHVFVLQEYLEKAGYDINEIVEKTAKLFEAGRFPDRQAYNKDGILVTFPNKQYRDRAVNKGTHFAENPKKAQANIFKADAEQGADQKDDSSKPKEEPATLDQTLEKDIVSDKDTDDRTPKEKQIDAGGVEAILIGQTPLVNYSVDEAKKFGFYKKGFNWYDTEGSFIGEQVYDESQSKNVIVSDAISPSSYLKKAERIYSLMDKDLLSKLEFLKNAEKSQRTLIFETIPILFANGINDFKNLSVSGDYHDYAIKFLKEWGDLRSKLETIEKQIARDENLKIYDLVDTDLKEIGSKNGVSLSQLGSPTDFIHKDIRKFYQYSGEYNKKFVQGKETKENTADIVLIYGGKADDVYRALQSGDISQQDEDSMAKVNSKDVKFALISLKAGSARLGHVLQQLVSYIGQEIPISPKKSVKENTLQEGIVDTIVSSIKDFTKKIKQLPEYINNIFQNFINLIKPFEIKINNFLFKELNADVQKMQSTELRNLAHLEKEIEKDIKSVKEDYDDCDSESAALKPQLIKNLNSFRQSLNSTREDSRLIGQIYKFAENPLLVQYFPVIIDKSQAVEAASLRNTTLGTIDHLLDAYDEGECVDRSELQPILKYRSNVLALGYIELILNNILKDVSTSNPEKIREEFIKLSSVLSSEAVFGNNVSLPLIKFTGDKIEKLRYKKDYKLVLPEKIDDLKLGKIRINILPSQGYLTVNLYLFNGIASIDDVPTPTYVYYLMDSSSGSKFTFKVEGQKVVEKI